MSQPHIDGRLLAGCSRRPLITQESRITSLTHHGGGNYGSFISFTSSRHALQGLAEFRLAKQGSQRVVVVDPRVRLEKGLPILSCRDEMMYYGVRSMRGQDFSEHHYLCVWEVTPDEVVGVWQWNDLSKNEYWFEEIIKPAVRRHWESWQARKRREGLGELSPSATAPPSRTDLIMEFDQATEDQRGYVRSSRRTILDDHRSIDERRVLDGRSTSLENEDKMQVDEAARNGDVDATDELIDPLIKMHLT